ncbi:MAG: dihydroorotate dehydrogenase electron transfer subunit [Acidobacteriota bacterium]
MESLCYASRVQLTQGTVLENRTFAGAAVLTVEAPEIARQVRPGQFVMAACARDSEIPFPLLKRALAVFTLPDRDAERRLITLLIKIVGDGTRRLAAAAPGTRLDLVGPLGNGFTLEGTERTRNWIVAGGSGLASVYLLAEELQRRGASVEVMAGGRTAGDLEFLEPFERLGVPLWITTEDGSRGRRGLVTAVLDERLGQVASERSSLRLFTCGPMAMMQEVTRRAQERAIPCQLSVEVKMACGFGVCLGCSVKTRQGYRLACTDGPVFSATEFCWESPRGEEATCGKR